MKGVILAGGTGTRLHPCTRVTNKHLLPVYNKPMIFYPLQTLKELGCTEVLIVSGGEHISDFMRLLGSGRQYGVHISYRIQDEPGGIAQALGLAETFFGNDKVVAILGDNIFESVTAPPGVMDSSNSQAAIFMTESDTPERFGAVVLDSKGRPIAIEEKPKAPKSNLIVTGLYIYPPDVFEVIKGLKPSGRGELEITDLNNHYLRQGRMVAVPLKGFWSDAGTFPTLLRSSIFVAEKEGER